MFLFLILGRILKIYFFSFFLRDGGQSYPTLHLNVEVMLSLQNCNCMRQRTGICTSCDHILSNVFRVWRTSGINFSTIEFSVQPSTHIAHFPNSRRVISRLDDHPSQMELRSS